MYDKAFFEWELELKKAQAEKRSPDFSLRPKEPARKLLTLSPNVSKSLLISALEESGKLGCCINATELDMVSGAIRMSTESMMTCFGRLFSTRWFRPILR